MNHVQFKRWYIDISPLSALCTQYVHVEKEKPLIIRRRLKAPSGLEMGNWGGELASYPVLHHSYRCLQYELTWLFLYD